MTEPTVAGKKGGEPALIELSNAVCTTGGGMATLSAELTLKRTSSEEICGGPEVLVNGTVSTQMPVEKMGSPSSSGGVITHTYDWSEGGVPCDATYKLKARAEVCVKTPIGSFEVTRVCPPCEM